MKARKMKKLVLLSLLACPAAHCMQDAAQEMKLQGGDETVVAHNARASEKPCVDLAKLRQEAAEKHTTVLHYAVIYSPSAEVLKSLVEQGADLEESNGQGTALQKAALLGRLDALRSLISLGANREARDNEGRTLLHIANCQAIRCLVKEFGANLEITDNGGRTPL